VSILEDIQSGSLKLLLGSKSPRRSELLTSLFSSFEVCSGDCDESFPEHLQGEEIAIYLSQLKSASFSEPGRDEILLTADTVVWKGNSVYGKPESTSDAEEMLGELSGGIHCVFTGVTLRRTGNSHSFVSATSVKFEIFTSGEIEQYVREYDPLDKAGAYGIQDCLAENGEQIGPLGMSIISGSYTNVIGLPMEQLKAELAIL